MKKINYPLTRATVAESSSLATNISDAIDKQAIEDEYLNGLTKELESKGTQMVTSIATDLSKEKTEEVASADDVRDNRFSALKYFLRGFMQWNSDGQGEKAREIYDVVKQHGLDLSRTNYEEESALLDSLLNDLKSEANAAALTDLSLTALIEDLSEAQSAFKAVYSESLALEAGKEDVVAATALKKETRIIEKEIIDYLNAMQLARPDVYGGVAGEVAELVDTLNQKVRTRK